MRRAAALLAVTALLLASGARGRAARSGPDAGWALRDRLSHGSLVVKVGLARGRGYHIVSMPLEAYVAGVLAGEGSPDSDQVALQALAITVRTFAVANLGRHRDQGFDLCNTTHCQVYRDSTPRTRQAAEATAGEILLYDGAPASVYYTAWCGGYTERPSEVWPGAPDPPYLPSRPDPACASLPGWSVDVPTRVLLRALHDAGFRGRRLRDLQARARDRSGRVTILRVQGLAPDVVTGQALRMAVGAGLIKSTLFSIERTRDGYRFTGRGSGHGVGLCVLGSMAMAAAGRSVADILQTYFPGTRIADLSAAVQPEGAPAPAARQPPVAAGHARGGIVVELPPGDEGDRASVAAAAAAARTTLAGRLGVTPPATIVIRVTPTMQAYEQATGRPWYTTGATRGHVVTLAPLDVLRARGMLDLALARGIVRVLTAPALAGRPEWVGEGAALFFSDPRSQEDIRAAARLAGQDCPTDADLRAPVSAGQLTDADLRAEACFARQIFKGKRWSEVK